MKTRTKLVWLELIGGIFGWVWMLASIAILGMVVMALAADWSWWNVLWAALVAAIAKWLARGFRDSQRRVAFEAQLVEQGMTEEEAGRAWMNAYQRGDL